MTIKPNARLPRSLLRSRSRRAGSARCLLLALAAASLASADTAHAYPLKFPSRASALPQDTYFRSSGHIGGYATDTWAIDFTAYQFDGAQWRANAETPATNEGSYIFGAELYAPEDGEVIACWRAAPDKPAPGQDYDFDGDGVADSSPMIGGNHLQIRNAAGDHVIFLAHLQDDSIPPSVCPLTTTDDWPIDNSKSCSLAGYGGYRASTVLPVPIPIVAGQFLGRIGHSGASSGPHLHMHVKPYAMDPAGNHCEGDAEEIEFVEGWSQPRSAGVDLTAQGWEPLVHDNPLPGENCFWPDPVGPRVDDLTLDEADDLHMVTDYHGAVVAHRNELGHLVLTDFDVTGGTGHLTPGVTIEEGPVQDVAIAVPYGTYGRDVVVAMKTSTGKLKLISYDDMVRQPSSSDYVSSGTVGFVEAARAPTHPGVVVAMQTATGDLKLIDFEVHAAANMDIDRDGSVDVGEHVDAIAIDTIYDADGFSGVVTADRNGNTLTVRTFAVDYAFGEGMLTTAGAEVGLGAYEDEVEVRWMDANVVVTAGRTINGDLALLTWEVDSVGDLSLIGAATAPGVQTLSLEAAWAADAVTAVSDTNGGLQVISWSIASDGTAVRRTGTRGAGAVDEVAIGRWFDWITPNDPEYLLVAARSGHTGELEVLAYETNFED